MWISRSTFCPVNQMNRVGFNPLLLFAGICSGAWPYARLFLLLQAWASTYRVPGRRGELVECVDGFGKYAYVELYILFFAIVLFHCHTALDENHALDVTVSPKFGLTGFWVSSVVAAALGHAILRIHRRNALLHRQRSMFSAANRRSSSVLTHGFTVDSPSHRSKRQLSRLFYGLLLLWGLVALVLLCLGLSREIFTVNFQGTLGELLLRDFGADQKRFSLLSLGSQFLASVASSTSLVMVGMAAFYFVTVLVMPMACVVLLGGLLLVPLSLERQISLLEWSEVARSSSAVEVAAVSVLLAAWQLPTIVNEAVQERCDAWLRFVVDTHQTEPLSCLRLETVFDGSAWYLVVGVVLHTSLVALCLRLARQAIEERLLRGGHDEQPPHHHHHNVVQFLAQFPWLARLVFAPPNDHYRLLDPSASSENGPPLQGQGGVSGTEPWQVTASFEDEWNEAAERDPEWKEWKDATQVT
jgi:hypothetical protein